MAAQRPLIQADRLQQLHRASPERGPARAPPGFCRSPCLSAAAMNEERLGDDLPTPSCAGSERHRDPGKPAASGVAGLAVPPLTQPRHRHRPPGRGRWFQHAEPEDHARDSSLAGARLAYQASVSPGSICRSETSSTTPSLLGAQAHPSRIALLHSLDLNQRHVLNATGETRPTSPQYSHTSPWSTNSWSLVPSP